MAYDYRIMTAAVGIVILPYNGGRGSRWKFVCEKSDNDEHWFQGHGATEEEAMTDFCNMNRITFISVKQE